MTLLPVPTPLIPPLRLWTFARRIFILSCKSGLLAASLASLVRPAPAATATPAASSAAKANARPAPVISFDDMRFDFGKIRHDQTVVHRYLVSNRGNATLHLKDVKAVCGCTSAVVGKTQLEPGETTAIEAVFTPEKQFSGAVRKTIMVLSDDPSHPKLTLRFAAEVLPLPVPNPAD